MKVIKNYFDLIHWDRKLYLVSPEMKLHEIPKLPYCALVGSAQAMTWNNTYATFKCATDTAQ